MISLLQEINPIFRQRNDKFMERFYDWSVLIDSNIVVTEKLVQVLGNAKSFNIFEKEFFTILQKFMNEISKIVHSKQKMDFD